MPRKKTLFSVECCVKLPNGAVLPWSKATYDMEKVNGQWVTNLIDNEFLLPESDRLIYEAKMMKRAGQEMSLLYE